MKRVRAARASIDLPSIPADMEWMASGKCFRKGLNTMFLPGRVTEEQYEKVKQKYCYQCPVRAECLIWAIRFETRQKYTSSGIWGGVNPTERKYLRRRIRDSHFCITYMVRRYLLGQKLPGPDIPKDAPLEIIILDKESGKAVYEGLVKTDASAYIVAKREATRYGQPCVIRIINRTTRHVRRLLANLPAD